MMSAGFPTGSSTEASYNEDLALLSKVALGDRRAFDRLANKHIAFIRRVARTHTRRPRNTAPRKR